MYNKKEFEELAADTKKKMLSFGASSRTSVERFDRCVMLFGEYLSDLDLPFSLENGKLWLNSIEHSSSKVHDSSYTIWVAYKRVVHLLADNQQGNLDEWKMYKEFDVPVPSSHSYMELCDAYRHFLALQSYSETTIRLRMTFVEKFLMYLEQQDAVPFTEVTNEDVAGYFLTDHFKGRKPSGIKTETNIIKLFLEYTENQGIAGTDFLHYAVPVCTVRENRIITTISHQGEAALLEEHPGCVADKRERAAYLLALRMGLRSCDIYDLRFQDIDWEKGVLSITQKKTKVELHMQMDHETQNALIDYILNERRELQSEYIFVTAFGHLKRKAGHCRSLRTRMNCDDVEKHLPHDGLHILRRTFASRLLENGVPLPVISAALGHIGQESSKPYLSADEKVMRKCALGLDGIPCRREEF